MRYIIPRENSTSTFLCHRPLLIVTFNCGGPCAPLLFCVDNTQPTPSSIRHFQLPVILESFDPKLTET